MKTTIQNKFFRKLTLTSTTCLALVASASVFAQTPTFPGPKPIPSQAAKLDRLDATVVMPNGMSYFFHNKKYSLFDIARNKKAQTTRLDRAATFQKKLPANLDAALIHPINRKVYIFKGNQYYRYNFFKTAVDKTRTIGVDGWKGLNGSFDAALSHPTQNAAYFFKGNKYQVYSYSKKKVVKEGVIGKDYWRGMPTNIDAAMMHSNGKAYFFKGDQYYRFDFNTNRRDKKAKIGKTGWKGLAFARDTSADNDIKLKISLTRIHPHQVEDSDDIGDYSADQWLVYKAGNSIKTPIDRVVSIASKQPSLLHENNDGTTFAKPIGEFLMSSGTIDIKNGQAESKYVRGAGNVARQLHLREGQTKTINNSVVYNINPEEIRDKNAKFEIHTKLIELDNCGKEWYKPGLFDDGGCDKLNVSVGRRAEIDIFEVLKYLQNPSSFGPHYFSAAGGYHKYSSDNNVMKFRDDSGGALEGKIVLRTKSGDEKHDYWIRLELIQ